MKNTLRGLPIGPRPKVARKQVKGGILLSHTAFVLQLLARALEVPLSAVAPEALTAGCTTGILS